MNYNLAKQLKDCGYPQKEHSGYFHQGDLVGDDDLPYVPTLSELIEACGDKFKELVRNDDGNFECRNDYMDMETAEYPTPEEAMAHWYLKIHEANS